MRRWTDGKSWSASRVSGSFLTYREMEGKRGGSAVSTPPVVKRASGKPLDGSANGDSEGEGPDGYRYKPDGLMKQSFSITTSSGQHLHLISYYSRSNSNNLPQLTNDAQLRHIRPPKNMYPESTVNEAQTVTAVTRGPMPGSPYSAPGHSMGPTSPYARPGPVARMYAVPVYPPTPPNGTPPLRAYAQHPYFYGGVIYAQHPYHPQAHVFDRPPPPMANPNTPPGHLMLVHHPAYAAHAAHAAQQYMANPPQRGQSAAEQAQQYQHSNGVAPPPAPASSIPEQGPQLPAINGAAAGVGVNKLPTPEPSGKSQAPALEPNSAVASRPLPTLGSPLNGDAPDKDNQTNSRSRSRSPNTASRFPRDLAPERLAKNSSAADSSALNKLNSVFVRS